MGNVLRASGDGQGWEWVGGEGATVARDRESFVGVEERGKS